MKAPSKNQITVPDALVRALGQPNHFKLLVHEGNLVLSPPRLTTFDGQAKDAGVPPAVLKPAPAIVAKRNATLSPAASRRNEAS